MFEVVFCQGCGAEHLSAVQVDDRREARAIDGWLGAEADAEDEDLPDVDVDHAAGAVAKRRLVQVRPPRVQLLGEDDDVAEIRLDPSTGIVHSGTAVFRMTLPEGEAQVPPLRAA
ncbi:MAG: hypothetical protein IPJ34_40910 [Myxococcales bacterium]|nr:hypothetical protein [Myxococcales bacterium]